MKIINLNKFTVKLYPLIGVVLDTNYINSIMDQLNGAMSAKDLCESLLTINGVSCIQISNKDGKLLSSTKLLDENDELDN
jgi:hypothetical protein